MTPSLAHEWCSFLSTLFLNRINFVAIRFTNCSETKVFLKVLHRCKPTTAFVDAVNTEMQTWDSLSCDFYLQDIQKPVDSEGEKMACVIAATVFVAVSANTAEIHV